MRTSLPCDPGLPNIPELGTPLHFQLLRKWISDCNRHPGCKRKYKYVPTRVLEVQHPEDPKRLRLFCPGKEDVRHYIALSHRWGDLQEHEKFCTVRGNISALCEGIEFASLPKTFQDAVTVTRGLGIRFLWIDSLCIVQDDPEDWEREAKCMEMVFSSAYCTIAATSAENSAQGFLANRLSRAYMRVPNSSAYLCEAIDDFRTHAEEADLNQRGWVLQERLVSRRTIHFTSRQTYWECGGGIRCETLTKLTS
jgi:hypothetical protein